MLALVGAFYLLPTLYGVLGRIYTPQLLISGRTDAVVVLLPTAALGDVDGDGSIDIVTPTQEFDDNPSAPETPGGGAQVTVLLPNNAPSS